MKRATLYSNALAFDSRDSGLVELKTLYVGH
jgi:hypothetical protein